MSTYDNLYDFSKLSLSELSWLRINGTESFDFFLNIFYLETQLFASDNDFNNIYITFA